MRPSALVVTVSVAILAGAGSAVATEAALFQFEQQAKQHCPGDAVVWVGRDTGLYSVAGERWYGTTRRGAFVCRREGEQAGYRPRHEPAIDRPAVTQAALPSAAE